MTSRTATTLSPPTWGLGRRVPLGGLALVGFWALLWALFLGTVGPRGAADGAGLTSREAVARSAAASEGP